MGKLLVIRIKEKGAKGDKCYDYKNEVSLNDANMLALILNDLICIYNAPIEKALRIMKKEDDKFFPFINK